MTLAEKQSPKLIDINYCEIDKVSLFQQLNNGNVIIIRNAEPIKRFHHDFMAYLSTNFSWNVRNDIESFYNNKTDLSFNASIALSKTIKFVRDKHLLGKYLTPLVLQLNAPPPVLVHNGISRLVINTATLNRLKNSAQFEPEDFKRKDGLGNTEIFMPGPAPVHRDYNRNHYLFMINIWFPMHSLANDETIRIYPEHYHQPISELDVNDHNTLQAEHALEFEMQMGDMVLFHSEQLHSSPTQNTDSCRRHSFDFRVAAHCKDNNLHYRNNFYNVNNFMVNSDNHEINYFEKASGENGYELIIDIILSLKTNDFNIQELEKSLASFGASPFSEDRYLELVSFLLSSQPQTCQTLLDIVSRNSNSPFWMLQVAIFYKKLNMQRELNHTVERIQTLIDSLPSQPDYMPVKYTDHTIQLTYDDIRRDALKLICEAASENLITN